MQELQANPAVQAAPLSVASFVNALFEELDAQRVVYCVLHSYQQLPALSSDLDMAVAPDQLSELPVVIAALGKRGYPAVQSFNYAVGSYYFVFVWIDGSNVRLAAVDIISEHREGHLILTPGAELVRGRRRFRDFWVPSAATQYRYLLAKKVLKGAVSERQSEQLADLASELGRPRGLKVCERLFGARWGALALEASLAERLGEFLDKLKPALWRRQIARRPWMPLLYWFTDVPRVCKRLARPTGLLVAVLGPDGAGKSTLIANIEATIERAFRTSRTFHWRPMLLFPGRSEPVVQPHARPSYGFIRSLTHLAGHFADYQIGFLVRVRPLLARSGLVLFDRYFHDLAADPKRYRYGGPKAIPGMLSGYVPRPDLVLILDAPEETILDRKAETSAEEIREERDRYAALAFSGLPVSFLDASQRPEQVAFDACRLIVDCLRSRFAARHGAPVKASNGTALDQTLAILRTGSEAEAERHFAVLPDSADPRWMIPVANGLENHSDQLSIYTPYARKARVMKAALSAAMRLPASIWAKSTVSIPAQGPLEDLVRRTLGESSASFTISLGTPGLYRKATVQIAVSGRIAAFLKIPLTPEANHRLEHEAAILAALSCNPALRAFLPSVLYAGDWNGRFVLMQSPLGGRAGSTAFGDEHREFLSRLAGLESKPRAVKTLLDEIGCEWEAVAHLLDAADRTVVSQTLRAIERNYSGLSLECGYVHGDFAPWNTRRRPDCLGVFDWEAAEISRPHEWDAFHFQTQTGALLGRDAGYRIHRNAPGPRCSYLLYLAHSTSSLLAEQGVKNKDFAYRLRRMNDELKAMRRDRSR